MLGRDDTATEVNGMLVGNASGILPGWEEDGGAIERLSFALALPLRPLLVPSLHLVREISVEK